MNRTDQWQFKGEQEKHFHPVASQSHWFGWWQQLAFQPCVSASTRVPQCRSQTGRSQGCPGTTGNNHSDYAFQKDPLRLQCRCRRSQRPARASSRPPCTRQRLQLKHCQSPHQTRLVSSEDFRSSFTKLKKPFRLLPLQLLRGQDPNLCMYAIRQSTYFGLQKYRKWAAARTSRGRRECMASQKIDNWSLINQYWSICQLDNRW